MMPRKASFVTRSRKPRSMRLRINGEECDLPLPSTPNVADLVAALGLDLRKAALERNRLVLPKSRHTETALNEGDEIEIVQFIGGG